ncbi:c-type cytochrome biogenesis protein CcsB [Campylobacter sp. MIT 99-7217]|uniref:c-type cytochrome biogenesis protein CcsB n=1 Tax=Campylobacter sp. MIT 99-7217 TaxID=535091 RepID=UPI00115C2968|nr:c-type cytochrome biogenesis protein CcsB [Campylobacter sp. MIT 99-7217]TQR33709.1 c-type cytochrome biogenesis protein CcsB [Campylobacter sp. MIT 99-7217]
MKNIIQNFGDLKISIALFLLFALFCALATFIESAYGTPTAWAMIYGTLWFGFIQLLLGLNLACAMFRYKMFMLKKLPLALFHFSFLFILLGAAMTRYMGFEGNLHIRENEENAIIESSKSFIKMSAFKEGQTYGTAAMKDIGLLPFANDLKLVLDIDGQKAKLSYKNLLLDAKKVFSEDENASGLLALMLSNDQGQTLELVLNEGEVQNVAGINFAFLNDEVTSPYVKIDKNLKLSSSENLNFMQMSDGSSSKLQAQSVANSEEKRLYTLDNINFVVKFVSLHAKEEIKGANRPQDDSFWLWFKNSWLELFRTGLISLFGEPQNWKNSLLLSMKDFAMSKEYQALELSQNARNALELELEYKGVKKNLYVFEEASPVILDFGVEKFFVAWSTSTMNLPFSLYLKDFILDRYPGSMSPQSYASEVIVKDDDNEFDFRIFMNNVLDYRGFRLYQSSYDQDELGTILSVNKDPGKIPTYIGYFLLCLGMFLSLLNPNSRFRILAKLVSRDSLKNIAVALFCLGVIYNFQSVQAEENQLPLISKEHSKQFAFLAVQKNGRIVPFDTLAMEILEKVYKDTNYKGQDASGVILSMLVDFRAWSKEPIIIMPRNKGVNEEISKILGINPSKYVSILDFFDEKTGYKLTKYVENANRKSPNARGVFDKELIKLDERANIVNLVLSTELFRIFPQEDANNTTWLNPFEVLEDKEQKNPLASLLLRNYFINLDKALNTNDYTEANKALEALKLYQQKMGASIMPSENKIATEVFVNHAQIFVKLTPLYLLAGALLLILILAKMIQTKIKINFIFKLVYICNIIAFLIHTLGLILRAYLADHAPWSNAYESMVYIAWALALSGIFFSRKSPIALALTSILAGVVLHVAHLGEMDPQITNLVPVLKSYWLSIHVSVITASYGFLGLCCLLGIFVLILMCFLKKEGKHNENILRNITEASRINEMAMILGLILLTIGNFLGAIWANESWGRYWSWDSKETWALISILIYAAVLHMRLVPKFNNQYSFALWSMFAYWSIIMTYFGVNYFLVGLHSYAAGEAAQIPPSAYYSFLFMLILGIISSYKKQFIKKL